MITAEWKPLGEIVASVKGRKKILVAGCATCTAECAAGGEREVEALAPLIKMALAKDGEKVEVLTTTFERQCEPEFLETEAKKVEGCDAVVSLACGIGIQLMAERFAKQSVQPGVNTTSLCIREEPGLWTARCAACGDCVLGETNGLCPIARCAKNLQNGPCGGTRKNGKCEIDENIDCIWYKIVERAAERGNLESLKGVRKSKNWSNSGHGGPKRMLREDLRP